MKLSYDVPGAFMAVSSGSTHASLAVGSPSFDFFIWWCVSGVHSVVAVGCVVAVV